MFHSIEESDYEYCLKVLGIVEAEMVKVDQKPELYELSLLHLREHDKRILNTCTSFFEKYDEPIHPRFVVERLQKANKSC